MEKQDVFDRLGLDETVDGTFNGEQWLAQGEVRQSMNPNDDSVNRQVRFSSLDDLERVTMTLKKNEKSWRSKTFIERGEILRQIGDALRKHKQDLGYILAIEMGKIQIEGEGEVQEVIDICDFGCGLSRTLNGKVMPSERKDHFMMEMWNPLGSVGVITAFNFPVAVFGWNFAISMICGNCVLWKAAPTAALSSIATCKIINRVLQQNDCLGILGFILGDKEVSQQMVNDTRINLVSFTGSTAVGRIVSSQVASRFGKCLLELGGNNAVIVMPDANLELVLKASVFSAVGTCGQRCTTLRRLVVHEQVYDDLKQNIIKSYKSIRIGNSLDKDTLCGPLHSKLQVQTYKDGLQKILEKGGKILVGGNVLDDRKGNFVEPTVVEVDKDFEMLKQEMFVPILYLVKFNSLEEGIEINNNVPQGLSSSLFTNNIGNLYHWIGPNGSDCGIVNVNIGPSGAEIGGAFGGEKETGGGRESGSDAWKQYMRRSTCTVNFGKDLPLAQGIKFDI